MVVNTIYSRIFFNYKLTKLFSFENFSGAKDSTVSYNNYILLLLFCCETEPNDTSREINRNKHSETL